VPPAIQTKREKYNKGGIQHNRATVLTIVGTRKIGPEPNWLDNLQGWTFFPTGICSLLYGY